MYLNLFCLWKNTETQGKEFVKDFLGFKTNLYWVEVEPGGNHFISIKLCFLLSIIFKFSFQSTNMHGMSISIHSRSFLFLGFSEMIIINLQNLKLDVFYLRTSYDIPKYNITLRVCGTTSKSRQSAPASVGILIPL